MIDKAATVACPQCHAAPGARCGNAHGLMIHRARVRAWEATLSPRRRIAALTEAERVAVLNWLADFATPELVAALGHVRDEVDAAAAAFLTAPSPEPGKPEQAPVWPGSWPSGRLLIESDEGPQHPYM